MKFFPLYNNFKEKDQIQPCLRNHFLSFHADFDGRGKRVDFLYHIQQRPFKSVTSVFGPLAGQLAERKVQRENSSDDSGAVEGRYFLYFRVYVGYAFPSGGLPGIGKNRRGKRGSGNGACDG